jgi:hypothetical protein
MPASRSAISMDEIRETRNSCVVVRLRSVYTGSISDLDPVFNSCSILTDWNLLAQPIQVSLPLPELSSRRPNPNLDLESQHHCLEQSLELLFLQEADP